MPDCVTTDTLGAWVQGRPGVAAAVAYRGPPPLFPPACWYLSPGIPQEHTREGVVPSGHRSRIACLDGPSSIVHRPSSTHCSPSIIHHLSSIVSRGPQHGRSPDGAYLEVSAVHERTTTASDLQPIRYSRPTVSNCPLQQSCTFKSGEQRSFVARRSFFPVCAASSRFWAGARLLLFCSVLAAMHVKSTHGPIKHRRRHR